MADFFSNLGSGIRFPDARIGSVGPLPTSLSGPAGINGDPDGRGSHRGYWACLADDDPTKTLDQKMDQPALTLPPAD